MAFAGLSDWLWFEPGKGFSLSIDGLGAAAAGGGEDNLVLKAARELASRVPGLRGGRFHLAKHIPVAAGLGGGSSDAAAALRALAHANGLTLEDARIREAAIATGSDVPVCLDPRARVMRGRGEQVGPALGWPPVYALLVNPGVPVSTRAVFARLRLARGETLAAPAALPAVQDCESVIAALAAGRNDIEPAARAIAPEVGEVLAALGAAPGARLARMSGSGATCFALFGDRGAVARAARAVARDRPGWWVRGTALR